MSAANLHIYLIVRRLGRPGTAAKSCHLDKVAMPLLLLHPIIFHALQIILSSSLQLSHFSEAGADQLVWQGYADHNN
jgi:hypothetical protein